MKNTNRRTNKTVAIALCTALILNVSGCSNAKNLKEDVDVTLLPESTVSETTVPETTEESTTATTTAAETSETEESKPDVSETETIETNVSEESVTFVPSEETEKQPTKASKKSSEEPVATESKKATVETTAPAANTPMPATPTPTPSPVPKSQNEFPSGYYDVGVPKSKAVSAAKAAIRDLCSNHQTTVGDVGQEMTYKFQIEDTLMLNQQRRADRCASAKQLLGHEKMSGTFRAMEGCASLGAQFDGVDTWYFVWSDHSGKEHWYTDFYQCIYDCTKFLITEHTTCLTTDTSFVYYGIGFSGWGEPDPNWYVNYGWEIPWYEYYLYIGGETQLHPGALLDFDLYQGIIPDFDRNEPWYKQFVP